MQFLTIALPTFFLVTLKTTPAFSVEASHPHTGKLAPFQPGDPGIELNGKALEVLRSGKPYLTKFRSDPAGRELLVQDIKAPVNTVWSRILDFDLYKHMNPETQESQTYRTDSLPNGQRRFWTEFTAGHSTYMLKFYTQSVFDPEQNSLTWTLDYT
jgi:hypothetical protein